MRSDALRPRYVAAELRSLLTPCPMNHSRDKPSKRPVTEWSASATIPGPAGHADVSHAPRRLRYHPQLPPPRSSRRHVTTAAQPVSSRACASPRSPVCSLIQAKGYSPSTGVPMHVPRVPHASARGRRPRPARMSVSTCVCSPRSNTCSRARPPGSTAAYQPARSPP